MNKSQEYQLFLEFLPKHLAIFDKSDEIDFNIGNTIIDKETLISGFKEPGKKKLECLFKHLVNTFRVFTKEEIENDEIENKAFQESDFEKVMTIFKSSLKENKKKNQHEMKKNQSETMNKSAEITKKTEPIEPENPVCDEKFSSEISYNQPENPVSDSSNQKSVSIETKNFNWAFEWKISIEGSQFISGCIKNKNDLENLMNQMSLFFNKESSNMVESNTISFEKDFALQLTEEDLKELDLM